MQKRKSFFPTFFIFLALSILIFILSSFGLTKGLTGVLENSLMPLQKFTFGIFHKNEENKEIALLKDENQKLTTELIKQVELKRENEALRSQFQLTDPPPKQLVPAVIIGQGLNTITIDKGNAEKIKEGMTVVFGNNLIGKISKVSIHMSTIDDLRSSNFSTTAKTLKTNALGIIKGDGDKFIMTNVVLSEKLEKGDLILTKGDIDSSGQGFPPDLVIGKIETIDKKASSLFQSAGVKSLIDFEKMEKVFVMVSK